MAKQAAQPQPAGAGSSDQSSKTEISELAQAPAATSSKTHALQLAAAMSAASEHSAPGASPDLNKNEPLDIFLNGVSNADIIIPRSSTLKDSQRVEIITKFAVQQNITHNQALVVIAILFQSGGTAKSCDGNLQCSAFGKTFKLAFLRKALTDSKCKGLERKLGRVLSNEIYQISSKLQIPGNLSQKIIRSHPERQFSAEESYWLSDFHAENLENCPEIIRGFITKSFEKRESSTKPPQKGRKTGK